MAEEILKWPSAAGLAWCQSFIIFFGCIFQRYPLLSLARLHRRPMYACIRHHLQFGLFAICRQSIYRQHTKSFGYTKFLEYNFVHALLMRYWCVALVSMRCRWRVSLSVCVGGEEGEQPPYTQGAHRFTSFTSTSSEAASSATTTMSNAYFWLHHHGDNYQKWLCNRIIEPFWIHIFRVECCWQGLWSRNTIDSCLYIRCTVCVFVCVCVE